tara:strand:+ start:4628 stop:5134 length:507 start_codon:yes stop_codon:yes gene_type:complete
MEYLIVVERRLGQAAKWLAHAGGLLVLLDAIWITVSVFRRYVLNDPDPVVTEAAALLLLPLAFAGLAYAFAEDANPKVTLILEKLPVKFSDTIEKINILITVGIGALLTAFAGGAALRSYMSGAASPVIEWPEYFLWIAVCLFSAVFTLLAVVRLIRRVIARYPDNQE